MKQSINTRMIEKLMQYDSIGWDFDNTLVGDINSVLMHRFIKATPEKSHYIITFRTHGEQYFVWDELSYYPTGLNRKNFAGVFNIEDEKWERFQWRRRQRKMLDPEMSRHPDEEAYLFWKGQTCHEHGIPVLIDDMADHVEEGCRKYGVTYFHPDDLWS